MDGRYAGEQNRLELMNRKITSDGLQIAPAVLDEFSAIVGEKYAIRDALDMQPFLVEWRDRYRGQAAMVVKPASTEEVSAIMTLASRAGIPIVPQGGNTGLVGGQIPFEAGGEVVLALSRLNRIREVDPQGNCMTVEAGVTLEDAQKAAEDINRLFPLALASQGSCQIGGNLATNAGGTGVLAYGMARDLTLGLEVVLADGRVWNGLRKLRKDNTGYDLRDLFIGSEGTLGIITAAVLKLYPRARESVTAFLGLDSMAAVVDLFGHALERSGSHLTAFEFMPRVGLEFVMKHGADARDPLAAPHQWYVLMEISSGRDDVAEPLLEQIFSQCLAAGIVEDGALARSESQSAALWRLRRLLSEVQKREGGSIKHDVSVPVSQIPLFIERANTVVETLVPGSRPLPFGHLGDGNVHYNVSQPLAMERQTFLARWEEVAAAVHAVVTEMGGSISAEHGIGRMKRQAMAALKDPVELDLMRTLKRSLDPNGILNPGKLL